MENQRDWFQLLAVGYAITLFVVGLILMLWPRKRNKKNDQ